MPMLWIALMLFPDTITDIIKLSYSQKLNVLKILWTIETFKLIIGMWLWQYLSSYCWCVFTSLAEFEGLKINFKKTITPGAWVLRRWFCPQLGLSVRSSVLHGQNHRSQPRASAPVLLSGASSWEHPSFPPAIARLTQWSWCWARLSHWCSPVPPVFLLSLCCP